MKFSILWHLTRDLNMTKSSFNRTFDRFVFFILVQIFFFFFFFFPKNKTYSIFTTVSCSLFKITLHHAGQSELLGSVYQCSWSSLAESGPSET